MGTFSTLTRDGERFDPTASDLLELADDLQSNHVVPEVNEALDIVSQAYLSDEKLAAGDLEELMRVMMSLRLAVRGMKDYITRAISKQMAETSSANTEVER